MGMKEIKDLSKEEILGLLEDASKNWLSHDGLWFRAIEEKSGLKTAIELDRQVWEKFTVIEAKRIMKRLQIEEGGGIPALVQALKFRLYVYINFQGFKEISDSHCIFEMRSCRVQETRHRQGLQDFPCKSVGLVEYSSFAKTIDPRIQTTCLICPPDPHPPDVWCAWEFRLKA
jgi:hypothetical protein